MVDFSDKPYWYLALDGRKYITEREILNTSSSAMSCIPNFLTEIKNWALPEGWNIGLPTSCVFSHRHDIIKAGGYSGNATYIQAPCFGQISISNRILFIGFPVENGIFEIQSLTTDTGTGLQLSVCK